MARKSTEHPLKSARQSYAKGKRAWKAGKYGEATKDYVAASGMAMCIVCGATPGSKLHTDAKVLLNDISVSFKAMMKDVEKRTGETLTRARNPDDSGATFLIRIVSSALLTGDDEVYMAISCNGEIRDIFISEGRQDPTKNKTVKEEGYGGLPVLTIDASPGYYRKVKSQAKKLVKWREQWPVLDILIEGYTEGRRSGAPAPRGRALPRAASREEDKADKDAKPKRAPKRRAGKSRLAANPRRLMR